MWNVVSTWWGSNMLRKASRWTFGRNISRQLYWAWQSRQMPSHLIIWVVFSVVPLRALCSTSNKFWSGPNGTNLHCCCYDPWNAKCLKNVRHSCHIGVKPASMLIGAISNSPLFTSRFLCTKFWDTLCIHKK